LLERNPALARTLCDRFPCIDPLIQVQIELLKRYRAGDTEEAWSRPSTSRSTAFAASLRNSG
jgi:phosphoenolpyruvate carboxylase